MEDDYDTLVVATILWVTGGSVVDKVPYSHAKKQHQLPLAMEQMIPCSTAVGSFVIMEAVYDSNFGDCGTEPRGVSKLMGEATQPSTSDK